MGGGGRGGGKGGGRGWGGFSPKGPYVLCETAYGP